MADSVLEILIRFGLDAEKAKEAEQIIRQTTSETREAGQATEEMGEKEEEASKFTELLHHNHRALHQILHMLGHETVPELGHALTGALYGWVGIVIALGAAFEYFHKRIEEANEKLEKISETKWDNLVEGLNKANEAANNYQKTLDAIAGKQETIKEKDEADNKILDTKLEKWKAILDAMEKAALAAAGDDKEKQEAIKKQFEGAKSQQSIEAERIKVSEQIRQRDNAQLSQRGLKTAADTAEARLQNLSLGTDQTGEDVAELQRRKDELDKLRKTGAGQDQVDAIKKQLEAAETSEAANPTTGLAFNGVGKINELKEKILRADVAADALAAAENRYIEQQEKIDKQNKAIDQAKEAADKATKALQDNVDSIAAYNRAIATATEILNIHTDTSKSVANVGVTGAEASTKLSAAIQAIIDARKGIFSKQDQQVVSDFKQLVDNLGWNGAAVVEMLRTAKDIQRAQNEELKALKVEIVNVQKQVESQR